MQDLFGFYHASLKHSPTGVPFQTYAGYRAYLIVGKKEPGLLGETQEVKIRQLFAKYRWLHVPDLDAQLLAALSLEVSRRPMLGNLLSQPARIVWKEPSRRLKPRESEWVHIVQTLFDSFSQPR